VARGRADLLKQWLNISRHCLKIIKF
jgi:hypothetical protein